MTPVVAALCLMACIAYLSPKSPFSANAYTVVSQPAPEFDHEKIRENVVEKIAEFKLKHPSMMDNDFGYWEKMQTRYWPTYYLIDKQGQIRNVFIGESHRGRGYTASSFGKRVIFEVSKTTADKICSTVYF